MANELREMERAAPKQGRRSGYEWMVDGERSHSEPDTRADLDRRREITPRSALGKSLLTGRCSLSADVPLVLLASSIAVLAVLYASKHNTARRDGGGAAAPLCARPVARALAVRQGQTHPADVFSPLPTPPPTRPPYGAPPRPQRIRAHPDRRPIDPPPIVQLRVIDPSTRRPRSSSSRASSPEPGGSPPSAQSFLQNPYYFMFASLAKPDEDVELHWLKDGKTRCTTGSVVSSLYHLKDAENGNADAGFFVFPDLSVRTEGSYRLKLSLFEVVG
ncbi:hypothetical protein A0H81_05608 [Grifola frondosa]|uniref:Velvet domain-containing protein n=1 Tax=Grifola frondosa TaxID=5627 RepID=A0A1C7MDK7_GRIFR|nr:hypothetical protein A0H81_05608 [Grifola frondosa]